jgi:uncharacterized protein (TIGR03067 family)
MLSVKSLWLLSCLPLMLSICCFADEAKDEAIKKDRKQIQGNWRIIGLEINGNKAKEEDARKLMVINGDDGSWKLMSEGKELCRGTSTIDPTAKPKQLDFAITEGSGAGNQYHAIYDLGDKKRKMCFASKNKERPTDFVSATGSEIILVYFEREIPNPKP